ncbi:CatB-related O-acetyltransferase [Pedobacter sp. MC2016-24]|uniref:xenobiotic acyltransferase family protein n=1 Tax=Pedobacter sp. MC2016-24 TaxID=2780090 RepID=UPI0018802519|nr:CatB-related O-acetyltransferase [Pedobacter sp. MC2016-24]MBE9599522.1 antibiotic acetyltransferase [Pedobacter sp. MC2016-24]
MNILTRILLLIPGFFLKLIQLGKVGARDIHNTIRFRDVIVGANTSINPNCKISENVHIYHNCIINNVNIDSFTYIGYNCTIQNSSIGRFCSIANDVFIGLGTHPTDLISTSPIFYRRKTPFNIHILERDVGFNEYSNIAIGHDVWIGARATVLDGVKIGQGAIIAANSVVTKDVPPYSIVAGVPAKILKYRFEQNVIDKLIESNWWLQSLDEIKDFNEKFKT